MSANGQIVAVSPADQLRDRLEDPGVAASLNTLLDHADLVAILVAGLDGFVRRGDEITDSLSSAIDELRASSLGAGSPRPDGAGSERQTVDLKSLAASLKTLATVLTDAGPALERILHSPMVDPQAVEVLGHVGQALVEGKAAATADPRGPNGLFGLWKVTKDKDVNRGLGFLIQVARAFGRRLPQ